MSLLDQNSNQYKNHALARLREKFYIALWACPTAYTQSPRDLWEQANKQAIMFFNMERVLQSPDVRETGIPVTEKT